MMLMVLAPGGVDDWNFWMMAPGKNVRLLVFKPFSVACVGATQRPQGVVVAKISPDSAEFLCRKHGNVLPGAENEVFFLNGVSLASNAGVLNLTLVPRLSVFAARSSDSDL